MRSIFGDVLRRIATCLIVLGLATSGCKKTVPPGSANTATAMGDWTAWNDLSPLVQVAESHAPEPAMLALREASSLLAQGKAKSADRRLAEAANGAGRKWIAVARADNAALHFSLCIRGIAWRLQDGDEPSATDRGVDFSEDTPVEPGDVSVEALLTNVEDAMGSEIEALVVQARIARARVAAFAQRCAPNEDVAARAQQSVEADLATLAAEGHLTPDLAYLWAGVQMNRFSGTAARPFLLQALEGGFDHPAVTFMLSVIALEQRELEQAAALAKDATTRYEQMGDAQNVAESWFLRGEIARTAKKDTARKHYEEALQIDPLHASSTLALATLISEKSSPDDAVEFVYSRLPMLVYEGPLNHDKARLAAANLEGLVIMATEPMMVQISRDALLNRVDLEKDAMRRGLRYFFAATLEARLRDYKLAHGHGVMAKEEFLEAGSAPVDVQAFLDRLAP